MFIDMGGINSLDAVIRELREGEAVAQVIDMRTRQDIQDFPSLFGLGPADVKAKRHVVSGMPGGDAEVKELQP